MKFICENCKAKYQIGDDKIAGRSVRMKCRRCGHLIQLNASVTDTSSHPDGALPDVETSFVETGSSASMPIASLLGAQAGEAVAQLRDEPDEDVTRAMSREQRAVLGMKEPHASPPTQQTPRTATPAPVAARPAFGTTGPGAAAPRVETPHAGPSGFSARGAIPAPAARPLGGAPAPGVARPAAAAPGVARPAAAARPVAAARPAPAAGVAGAFQKTLAEGTAPAEPPKGQAPHVPHGEDWYVGIGGVPLGPVRLAVIREKAITGAVHADSLVWREGFDEWQPLKNFPELLQIVDEAQAARSAGRRPSAVPPRAPTPLPGALRPVAHDAAPGRTGAPAAPHAGVSAPSPYQAKTPAPAGYQPKATQVGVGIPAVTLPGAAPRVSVTAPSPAHSGPISARPAAVRPAISPAAPPGRSSAVPPEPTRPSDVGAPHEAPRPVAHEAHRPVAHEAHRPVAHEAHKPAANEAHGPAANDAHKPAPHVGRHDVAPHSSTVVSPAPAPAASFDRFGGASAPAPAASFDMFGGVSAPAAPTPAPAPAASFDLFGGVPSSPAPVVPAPAPVAAPAVSTSGHGDPLASGVAASAALDVMKDPFAAPAPKPAPAAAPSNGRSSLASIETIAPPSRSGSSEAPLSIPGLGTRRRGGMHPLAYAFIAMAGAFGVVAAFLLFQRQPQPIIVYQPPPGSSTGAPVPGTAADTAAAPPASSDVAAADPSSGQPRAQGGGAGVKSPAAPTSTGASAPLDTSGFGNQVVPPPVSTPSTTGADPSLGQLSQGEIQGVVAANQPRVRKRCWQPALDAAGANASPNARVSGKIVIGPSGSVDSASASGAEKDYPGLASCIASQMKGWKFPPSGGSTPVSVPFTFAGQ